MPLSRAFKPRRPVDMVEAIRMGDARAVAEFLDEGDPVDSLYFGGESTPLIYAASQSQVEIVKLLLDRGADIDKQNSFGHTPLSIAASFGAGGVARLLLERGADLDKKTRSNETALDVARQRRYTDIITLLEAEPEVRRRAAAAKAAEEERRRQAEISERIERLKEKADKGPKIGPRPKPGGP